MTEKRTVKCCIALAVDEHGNWGSHGWGIGGADQNASTHSAAAILGLNTPSMFYVEVEVPIPTTPTIQAQATPAEGGGA